MSSQDTRFIELCYRYGASPAPKTVVRVPLLAERRFPYKWISSIEFGIDKLIKQTRFQVASSAETIKQPSPESSFWFIHERLNFYSLLELALFTKAIPTILPASFVEAAKREFANNHAGIYAEAGYPLAGAFLLRLQGKYTGITENENALGGFRRLLALDAYVRSDPSMLRCFWLASLAYTDDVYSSELSKLRDNTLDVLEVIEASEDQHHLGRIFIGDIWSFLDFCRDFDQVLIATKDSAVASMMRHYYSHVLDVFRDQRRSPLVKGTQTFFEVFRSLEVPIEEEYADVKPAIEKLVSEFNNLSNSEQWPLPSKLEELLGRLVVA